jgi:hypothetical protein
VGFEPTHISVVEIQAGLKSTALDHSAIVSRMEKLEKFWSRNIYIASKKTHDGSSGGEQKGVVLFGDFALMRGRRGVMSALVEHVVCGVEPTFATTTVSSERIFVGSRPGRYLIYKPLIKTSVQRHQTKRVHE